MSRAFAFLLAALALFLPATAVVAQSGYGGARVVASTSWVEEWDPASQRWVRIEDGAGEAIPAAYTSVSTVTARGGGLTLTETIRAEPTRLIALPPRAVPGVARFGPFRVLDGRRAALVASTDAASPRAFAAMLAAYPALEVIEFADAPGTSNDLANLALGRAIRRAGLATHVPAGGSARSGAVELFLAGTRRTMDPGALFAVHSWRDEAGREPDDFAPDAPENRLYLDYYAEMGMSTEEARAFYAMTNSVPHAGALWLRGSEMARWIAPGDAAPRLPATRSLVSGQRHALAHGLGQRRGFAASLPAHVASARPTLALLDSVAAFP